ncbi:superoxide dismutase [Nocardioides sp. CER19]|uniref:SMP-30/gluconolactonase/LRE family protein n=1 Tax=Nocardioides sp. CER19 TaxID=3038538 RepID=UPI00244B0900|nr:superoxide dismutase [Nocardioides sp. CER19]MDH2415993.1 superoxide dismutase [Nocardioides sp. CER19]
MMGFSVRAAGLAGLLALALVSPADAQHHQSPQPRHDRHAGATFPDHLDLPDGFQPEGITIGRGPTAWLGSLVDGDVYRLDLRTGTGAVVSQGPGTPSVGLKIDRRGRLFVAGGPTGSGRVVDSRTGAVEATYQFTTASSFVNDVLLTRRVAWFTDSDQPQLYGVRLGRHGRPAAHAFTLPLGGDWVQGAGLGANGITDTPNGRALLVVHTTSGLLYRVSPRTGVATVVDLHGASVTDGDGLLRIGRTLYVVRNFDNEVDVVHLDRSGRSGRVVRTLTSPDFDVPTTVAAFGRSLYLPNARFSTTPDATTPYWVTRIGR